LETEDLSRYLACHECDQLIAMPQTLGRNQSLFCPRCKSKQLTNYANSLDHSIAFSVTALILLIIANSFPFLSFEAQGQIRTISVLEASFDLYLQGFYMLAALVYAFVLLIPVLYLVAVLALLIPIKLGFKPPAAVIIGKAISMALPWAMAEVFMVGVLVALIKVIELADIVFGISFWAYSGFVLFFMAASNIASRHQLWHWIDDAR
jgi:paraquat-inducible protein A